MPIENERKYVLTETDAVERKFADVAQEIIPMAQRYLVTDKGMCARVRWAKVKGEKQYYFTFKKDCGVPGEVIEIETVISPDDFNKLWKVSSNEANKIRYHYEEDNVLWDVDFFKHDGHNYFAMAEVELKPGVKAPDNVPKLISENLIFTVPIDDRRFSSKKVGDVGYAISLLDGLKVKTGTVNTRILKKKYA